MKRKRASDNSLAERAVEHKESEARGRRKVSGEGKSEWRWGKAIHEGRKRGNEGEDRIVSQKESGQ